MAQLTVKTEVVTQNREEVPLEAEFYEDSLRFSLDGKLIFAVDFENFKEFGEIIIKAGDSINKIKNKHQS